MATFGDRLKELRDEKGLSQEQLAKEIGVRKNTIYRWETGDYRPSEQSSLLLAHCFNVPYAYLMGYVDDRTEPVLTDEEAVKIEEEEAKQDEEQMIMLYRMLSPEMQKMIRTTVNQAYLIDRDREALR